MGKNMIEIKNTQYHGMPFSDIDNIKKDIQDGKLILLINSVQLMLYLDQMKKTYAFILKRSQDLQIGSFLIGVVFIFLNWKIAILIFLLAIIYSVFQSRLPFYFIRKNCLEDRAFLKFALATELVKVTKAGERYTDPIYKEKNLTK
jgi:hypothetical protein